MTLIQITPYLFIVGILSLLCALGLYFLLKRLPQGSDLMKEIAESIHSGAMTFIKREYTYILVFITVVFVLLWQLFNIYTGLSF
ncbi:MAG TPA: sodium-translocating pyrophosphatase, partial [Candidatus Aminicenantes bacterium]|nr:sodium-translocating pyrophosphatase [Candidatus Aminicenantes bacterium]